MVVMVVAEIDGVWGGKLLTWVAGGRGVLVVVVVVFSGGGGGGGV